MPRNRRSEMTPHNDALADNNGATATPEEEKPKRDGPKSKREAERELDDLQRPPNEVAKDQAGGGGDDTGEQQEMFPELDENDPTQKAILKEAKKLHKIKAERDEVLSASKEKYDSQMEKLIGLMHEAKLTKVKYQNMLIEVFAGKEKAVVKLEPDEDGGEAGDDE